MGSSHISQLRNLQSWAFIGEKGTFNFVEDKTEEIKGAVTV